MKRLSTVLFGTAAMLVAVAGAQAADLGKTNTGQYAKVDSFYGAGFYYIPAADLQIKIFSGAVFSIGTIIKDASIGSAWAAKPIKGGLAFDKFAAMQDPSASNALLKQKLMSSASFSGSPTDGFLNLDATTATVKRAGQGNIV